jgi:hypothetical protein
MGVLNIMYKQKLQIGDVIEENCLDKRYARKYTYYSNFIDEKLNLVYFYILPISISTEKATFNDAHQYIYKYEKDIEEAFKFFDNNYNLISVAEPKMYKTGELNVKK